MKKILLFALFCAVLALMVGCGKACDGLHNEVVDEAVAPSCSETGLTEGKHCADCGTVTVKQEVIPPAHDYVDKVVHPSMLEGKYVVLECSLCGYELEEKFSMGLEITPDDETMTCTVKGKGECSDKEINIPPVISGYKVVGIAKRAFSSESKVTSVNIPDGVTTIGDYAFAWSSQLVSVQLPESITSIGAHTFSDCQRLKGVVIPEGVTTIGSAAFFSCSALEYVVIPSTMEKIGMQAFASSNLKKIFFGGTAEEWSAIKLEYGNGPVTPAIRYYYSETEPSVSNVYWHFVDGVPTVW